MNGQEINVYDEKKVTFFLVVIPQGTESVSYAIYQDVNECMHF